MTEPKKDERKLKIVVIKDDENDPGTIVTGADQMELDSNLIIEEFFLG